jgi:RHS repeat-associated protein
VHPNSSRKLRLSFVASSPRVAAYALSAWCTANAVRIESPTTAEVVIATPRIPGLELHLPRGTVITGEDGQVVRDVSITPIPVDRPPFPLPTGVDVPLYFTIQPGGAYVKVNNYRNGPKGAWLVYPNAMNDPPGQRLPFWSYEPEEKGWHVYGFGHVTPDGRQVTPAHGVEIYEFSGAMIVTGGRTEPDLDPPKDGSSGADPVDLATGLFVMQKTDLFLPDVLPLALTRTYRNEDSAVRPFGVGSTHPYDLWFANQLPDFGGADLILPDGARIHFVKTAGNSLGTYVLEHFTSPTEFYASKLTYNGTVWELRLKSGLIYEFALGGPLQAIRDRFGNVITITRLVNKFGNIAKITAPHGRYIEFTYDTSDRITQTKDNLGRTVTYTYDASGRIWKVTDVKGGVTEYTYNAAHRILTIKDPRGIVYLTNEYDTSGRVIRQTQADSGVYEFAYTLNGGQITQTDVTNPRGYVRRIIFDSARYPTSDTSAYGQSVAQTTTYSRLSGSELVETVTDGLSRATRFTYDTKGNISSVTHLYGTSDATTTTFSYDPIHNLVTSVTDPLSHTTTYNYDWEGRLTKITDPMSHETTFTTNGAGLTSSMTNALNKTTTFTYQLGDLVAITTALGHTETRFVDAAGRLLCVTDARGAQTRFEYDNVNHLTKITDPLGAETTFTYNANGNLLTLTDARGKTTTWTYDDMDRVATRTDPLSRQESFTYDSNGNLTSDGTRVYTWDARNQLSSLTGPVNASFAYDGVGRRRSKTVGGATTQFLYDGLTPVQELVSGTPTANLLTGLGIDEYFTRTDTGGVRDYFTDALGSTIALADGSGTVQTAYTYEPFGGTTTSGAPTGNTFAFTGREADGSGLYFNRARYYDPRTQRFISEDPLGVEGGSNFYAYVGNSPINWVDPHGLAACRYSIGAHTLVCVSDNGANKVQIGPDGVFSGMGDCRNDPNCAAKKDRGPVPPGDYELVPSTKYGGSWWLKEGWLTRQLCKLGFGRCEFFLHLGTVTLGCITVDRNNPLAVDLFNRLRDLLNADPKSRITVE